MRPGRLCAVLLALTLAASFVPAHAETIRIIIDKLEFSPTTVDAKIGDTIEWVNNDAFVHTATLRGKWEVMIPVRKAATLVVKELGSMEYFCRFHPNMKGRINVVAAKP